MGRPRTTIALALLLQIILPSRAQQSVDPLTVDLSGNWQFRLGDNLEWKTPAPDQGAWEVAQVPATWESQGYPEYDGFAWYRRAFKVAPTLARAGTVVLHLGRIDDADEVYLNGAFVGATGGMPPGYYSAYNTQREYVIPAGLLDMDGENVLAVRVYDHVGDGGIVEGRVGLTASSPADADLIRLDGAWSFRTGDDPSWSEVEVDKEGWTPITVPGNWEPQGFRDYDGYAWYRKEFFLPEQAEPSDFVLLLGKIDDLDATYVNGKEVGRTGPVERGGMADNYWQQQREYIVPAAMLKPGDYNVIAVRVYDGVGGGGLYEGPHALYPADIDRTSLQQKLQNILDRVTGH